MMFLRLLKRDWGVWRNILCGSLFFSSSISKRCLSKGGEKWRLSLYRFRGFGRDRIKYKWEDFLYTSRMAFTLEGMYNQRRNKITSWSIWNKYTRISLHSCTHRISIQKHKKQKEYLGIEPHMWSKINQKIQDPVSVSTSGSRPVKSPIPNFFFTFRKAKEASSLANTALRAGFHCIKPRCWRRSVRLFALFPEDDFDDLDDFEDFSVVVELVEPLRWMGLLLPSSSEVLSSSSSSSTSSCSLLPFCAGTPCTAASPTTL